ncbi:MAG: TolC family protein [Pseudomonadota bacterium]
MPARLIPALACLCLCLLTAACLTPESYTYQAVKQEFAASRPEPAAAASPGQPQPGQPTPDLSQPLDLPAALAVALAQNPDQEMALMRIRQSEAMLDQALAAFLPMLSAYTEFARGDVPSGYLFKTIDQRLLPPNTNFNDPGTFQNWESGLRLRWNLFRGGQDYLGRQMAGLGVDIRHLDRLALVNSLVASVIKGFYNCLAAAQFEEIARQAVENVQAQVRVAQVRHQGGAALKSDLLSLQVRLAQSQEDLVRARNNHLLALAALANLLGADPDTRLSLLPGGDLAARVPPAYAQGVVLALERRPELQRVRRQVVSARLALDAARAQFLPRLDAQATYYWDDPQASYAGDRSNYSYGLLMNWDLFTGLSTVKEGDKARAALGEMLAADRQATLNIQLDVKSAYLGLAESLARLEVSRAAVAQAEEAHRLVGQQYQGGAVDVTRFLDADLNLNAARIRAAAAAFDTQKSRADIARALGQWAELAAKEPNQP